MRDGDGSDAAGGSSGPPRAPEGDAAPATPRPSSVDETTRNTTANTAVLGGAETAVARSSETMPSAQAAPQVRAGQNATALIGQVLAGRYEVTRQIGAGGMGAVYEARHTLIGKRVAVKVLLDKYAEAGEVVARLEQEARLASSIGHENIVDITDFGQTNDGRRFVVMEYLEGESVAALLAREGPLPVERIAHICRQIASALGAAHAKGIVHRDLKPENVFLLSRDGKDYVKVVDFGISKALRPHEGDAAISPRLTQTGMVLGTPLYMSPEQARGDESLDHRIDVYALGVMLYELATGDVPFRGANYLNIVSQVLSAEIPPPRDRRPDTISTAFEAVILKAMAREREHRYQTMEELAALESWFLMVNSGYAGDGDSTADVLAQTGREAHAPLPNHGRAGRGSGRARREPAGGRRVRIVLGDAATRAPVASARRRMDPRARGARGRRGARGDRADGLERRAPGGGRRASGRCAGARGGHLDRRRAEAAGDRGGHD